ncbi:hypothetical protein BCF11_2718 [Collimonas sp. PA-H2]|uniref:hypothetical protein n=1 Tax=Collimonas sp. PA-H2 TaxID=1881062 RepID=UPI000BF81242|nr:hypothetical protein [Collimonas sp. PA-H2]PFH10300.1 hypothetical protein BCF11_2718 [Collimonas sp. PA-H2]
MSDEQLQAWLAQLPLGQVLDIDGESIYLKLHGDGAELGALLLPAPTPLQVRNALQAGFSNARLYGAGLAYQRNENKLMLMQWLPGVSAWQDAADPLEQLLDQLAGWRAAGVSQNAAPAAVGINPDERRVRMQLTGSRS